MLISIARRLLPVRSLMMICSLVLALSGTAQKQYTWCPDELTAIPRADRMKGVTVDLVLRDARLFGEKVKDKCSFDMVADGIVKLVQKTFPSANFNRILSGDGELTKGRVLVEVTLTSYQASFISASWISTVSYSVKVSDHRSAIVGIQNEDISKERKAFNTGGTSTARKNLNMAFMDANVALLDYLADAIP